MTFGGAVPVTLVYSQNVTEIKLIIFYLFRAANNKYNVKNDHYGLVFNKQPISAVVGFRKNVDSYL